MGRRNKVAAGCSSDITRNKRGTPLYSKEDIREQYCITDRQLDVLEQARSSNAGFFGCLSTYQDSPCTSSRTSLLSVCVRRKVPSDENIHELCRRQPSEFAPYPRYPRYPFTAPPPELYQYDENLDCSYFRRRPRSTCMVPDPKRYTWMPEDEESIRMERPRSIRPDLDEMMYEQRHSMMTRPASRQSTISGSSMPMNYFSYSTEYLPSVPPGHSHFICPAHPDLPPPPPPPSALIHHDGTIHRTKHVSFARSHTLTSFDDATKMATMVVHNQERLLDGKKTADPLPPPNLLRQPDGSDSPKVVVLEKVKRGPMKTQATQTEVCLGRKPNALSLSPRTIQRVKMVSQGAQTNGSLLNGRRLTKSYSEAGTKFGIPVPTSPYQKFFSGETIPTAGTVPEHEPLQRTQSEEPPKSPYLISESPPPRTPTTIGTPPAQQIPTSPAPSKIDHPKSPPRTISPPPPTPLAPPATPTLRPEPITTQPTRKSPPLPLPPPPEEMQTETEEKEEEDESDSTQKEIIIDFEPQISPEPLETHRKKRVLLKTMSEGEILQERRKSQITDEELIPDTFITSSSQENIKSEPERSFTPYFLNSPILHEDIFKEPPSGPPSDLFTPIVPPSFRKQESVEEFHENLICGGRLWKRERSISLEDGRSSTSDGDLLEISEQQEPISIIKSAPSSPGLNLEPEKDDEGVVPTHEEKTKSPFASSDSLANDVRDHSDGIWNESQVTVLQADSGTDNGTVLSTSDLSSLTATSPSGTLLTPSSRRKHLLMLQHQQRSSMDTDALEEEFQPDQTQTPSSPRIKKEPLGTTTPPSSTTVYTTSAPPAIAVTPIPSKRALQEVPQAPTSTLPTAPMPSVRRSPGRGELRKHRSPLSRTPDLTPSETPHRSLESPDNAKAIQAAAEMLLGKTDSGKTTDISESTTTTTDDYVTANSDSSRRSGSLQGTSTQSTHGSQTGTQDGSSFESASSIYSLARGEAISEDVIPPSFSPPPILEETPSDIPLTPVPAPEKTSPSKPPERSSPLEEPPVRPPSKEPTSPSGESSSSCGSYSIHGSTGEMIIDGTSKDQEQRSITDRHRPSVPLTTKQPLPTSPPQKGESISDDDRSVQYSSSGNYESPADEHEGYAEDNKRHKLIRRPTDRKEWSEEEKRRRKKQFTLEFSEEYKYIEEPKKKSPSSLMPTAEEKVKRTKTRSPQRIPRKSMPGVYPSTSKKGEKDISTTTGMVRSPAMHDGFRPEEWAVVRTPPHEEVPTTHLVTSDESSGGPQYKPEGNGGAIQSSPRRHRRMRDISRRKSGPNLICSKSPTSSQTHRQRRRSGSIESKTIVSLTGTIPRRRSSVQPKFGDAEDIPSQSNRLSPHRYSKSPSGSPRKIRKVIDNSEIIKLKAVSAESLRSVSPGSDSVFYSETGSGTAALADQHQCVHCLHCGKEVDIVTTDNLDESAREKELQHDIVRPPADFADSPDGPRTKHSSGRLYKKLDKRYRSEERSHGERKHHHRYRQDVRAKSEERGKEENSRVKLRPLARSTDTSLEALKATASSPSMVSMALEDEEDLGIYFEPYKSGVWIFIGDNEEKYVWHKSEYQRHGEEEEAQSPLDKSDSSGTIGRRDSTESTSSEHEFRKRYQCVTHRMVHRKSCLEMYKRQASKSFESDKTVIVRRECGEFGFRIHGSKPVVVSAIEPDTPAETSGLEVGDIVISVNGVNVLDKSHSEVVKIAHAGSDTLELEVARTCDVLAPPGGGEPTGEDALYSGYLWRFAAQSNKWVRRWFVLKRDNCLYCYKSDGDTTPVGALMLVNYQIIRTPDCGRPHGFSIEKSGATGLQLAADNDEAATRWVAVISHAIERSSAADTWLDATRRNLRLAPSLIHKPDCFGYLMKLGTKWKSWVKRYCVLKDACLYFYQDANAKNAYGMACLHGYRVQQATAGGKKHAFEVIPPDPTQRHYYFHTDSDLDRKRWLAALEYSIDRWLRVG